MRIVMWAMLAVTAAALLSGCGMFKKEAYLVPTEQGWVEMESKDNGNKVRYRPAEKVKVEYK
ncbi:MAG: hypothetical protein NT045_04945 [Candidatus Aureabacteria bacterium]|nr:hypothetical protein [Candidatus Auribacterota bacterium]